MTFQDASEDIFRVVRSRNSNEDDYVYLDTEIIQNPDLCLEGKGCYGMLMSGSMKWKEVPEYIQRQLLKVGYIQEVI